MEILKGGRSETESFFYGDQPSNSEPSETDRFVSGQEETDRLKLAHDASLSIDPSKAQRVLKLEKETGLDQELIDRNLEDIEKEQKKKVFDAGTVQTQFPTTATWYGKNPNHAAVVSKYLDSATKLERAFQERGTLESIGQSVVKGLNSMNQRLVQAPALLYDVAALPQNLAVKAMGRSDLQVRAPEWLRNNSVAQYYKDQSELIRLPELDLSVSQLISNGEFPAAARVMAVQAAGSAPNLMALFAANYLSGGAASLTTAGVLSASGSAAEAAEQGADPAMATVNAVTQGTIEATAERLGTLGIFSKWEGAIARAHGKQAAGEVMKDFAKTIAASIGIEGLEEGVTSIGQDLSAVATGVNPDALEGTGQRAFDSFLLGGFMGFGMGAAGTTLGAGARLKSVADAQRAKAFYSSMGSTEEASELRKNLPDQHRELVENLTKDSSVENVYIPVEQFQSYFQSANENPTAIAQVLGVSESYNEAVETGGDIKVPLATWTERFVGTNHYKGLENDIKFSPEGLTFNQSKVVREELKSEMAKAGETQTEPSISESQADPVYDDVFNQLTTLGLPEVGEKEASIYATTVASFFNNMAARGGQSAEELYRNYGLQISNGEMPAVPNMPPVENQGFTPEFDENGKQVFDPANLSFLRRIISDGELVKSGAIQDESGTAVGYYSGASTFPDFFQNKGYTKKEVLGILDKIDAGKTLTEKQEATLSDLYNGMMEGMSRGSLYQSAAAKKVAQIIDEAPKKRVSAKVKKVTAAIQEALADPNKIVIFNSATAERNGEIEEFGVMPMHGSWIQEVAENTGVDPDEILSIAPQLAYYDEKPAWVFAQIARLLGREDGGWRNYSEFTRQDVVENAQLSILIIDRSDSDFRKLNDDGESFVDLQGNDAGYLENEVGVEPRNIVTEEILDPDFTLVGEDVIQFLKANYQAELDEFNESRVSDGAERILFQSSKDSNDPITLDLPRLQRDLKAQAEEFFANPETREQLKEEYRAKAETLKGRLLDTDAARELWPEYRDNPDQRSILSEATDAAAGSLVREIYEELLAQPIDTGLVILMGGGPGSGKSETLKANLGGLRNVDVVYDSVSANAEILEQRIEQALASGRHVAYGYVFTPIEKALGWIEERYNQTGRPVDSDYAAYAHVFAQEAAIKVAEKYAGNPRVDIQIFNNTTKTDDSRITVEELKELRYTGPNETPEEAVQRLLPMVKERLKDVQSKVEQAKQEALERASKNVPRAGSQSEAVRRGVSGELREGTEGNQGGDGSSDPGSQGKTSLNQAGHTPRGRITFGRDRKFTIDLFKHFDLSTFLHETGHFYMEVMGDLASQENAPQQIKDDYQTILKWMGVNSREEIQVEHHEKWARGFELYLRDGRAPSDKLRQAFARIKIWLTQIYQRMTDLNVEITPEIRSVMDRMLSSQEEIQAAYGQQNALPLFSDPKAVGMNDAQAERYTEARFEAQQAAEEILLAKLMEDHAREQRAIWKENWQKIEAKYEAEANSSPAFIALSILQKGTMPDGSALPEGSTAFKLSKEDLLNEVGKEGLKRLPRPYVYSSEGGVPLSMAAEMLGFESGDALYQALVTTEKKSEWVRNQTQAEMDQLFPDLLTSPLIKEEAVRAIHNDKLDELRRLELEHMASNNLPALKDVIRKVARRVPTTQMVREEAERFIGQKKLGELQPHVYRLAEAKSARLAGEALAKGEFDAAFAHKQRERLNAALFRAATDAKEEQAKAFKFFKKLNRSDSKISANRDVDYVNAARAILARFGIGRAEKTASEYLSMVQKYDKDAYSAVMAIVNSATENAVPYKELKFDDFMGLKESIEAIWDLAKSHRQMVINGKVMNRAEVESELLGRLSDLQNGKAKPLPGSNEAITDGEKRTIGVRSLINLATRVEHWAYSMDGGDPSGPFTKYVARPIFNATADYRVKKVETLERLREIVKGIDFGDPKVKIPAPEIGYKFSKPELIMALLHTGNESNLKKLLVGRGWGKLNEDGSLDRSRWDAMSLRMQKAGILTKADFDAVQAIWDLNDSLKPEAQKAFKRLNGHYFNEVTANSFMTDFGEYRGGYMPAIADPAISMDADARVGQSLEDNPAHMFPTTGKGFTKSRVESYTTPLSLDFSKIQSHIDKVLRFSYIEPAVRDVYKIMNGREIRAEVKAVASDAVNELIVPWLKRASTQKAALPGMSQKFDRAMSFFRRSASIQFMVVNIANAFQNTTGLFPSLTYVGAKHMAGSFRRYLSDRKGYAQSVMESSKYMQTRIGENAAEVQRDIDDMVTNPSKFKKFTDTSIQHGYFADRLTNSMVEVIVWGAAYNEALQEGVGHQEAVQRADSVVRKGIAGMNTEDASRYEGGTPFVRLFTMFSSFFNTQMNVIKSEIEIAKQEGFSSPEGRKRLARTYTFVIAIPAILSALIMRVMSGAGLDEDDDGEYFDDILDLFFLSQVKYATALLPGGTVINTAFNQFNDKPYDDKINLSPALSNLEKALKAPKSVLDAIDGGNIGNAVRDSLAAFGLATGYPGGAVARPLGYAADVSEGRTEPSGPIDAVRGLIQGRGPK